MKYVLMLLAVIMMSSISFAGNFDWGASASFAEVRLNGDYKAFVLSPAIGIKYEGIPDFPLYFMLGAKVSETAGQNDSGLQFRFEVPLFWKIGMAYGFNFWQNGEFKEKADGRLEFEEQSGLINPITKARQFVTVTWILK